MEDDRVILLNNDEGSNVDDLNLTGYIWFAYRIFAYRILPTEFCLPDFAYRILPTIVGGKVE